MKSWKRRRTGDEVVRELGRRGPAAAAFLSQGSSPSISHLIPSLLSLQAGGAQSHQLFFLSICLEVHLHLASLLHPAGIYGVLGELNVRQLTWWFSDFPQWKLWVLLQNADQENHKTRMRKKGNCTLQP